jgi:pSer/pThr/pTyr-binding forkhead associated (FHA) protein
MTQQPEDCPAWLEDENGNRLPIRGACSLGRSVSNQVPLADERVSRRHAVIQAQEGGYWLVDFGSRNGTYVNDQRIAQPTRLQHGAVVRLGPFQFVFRHPTAAQPVHVTTMLADRTVSDIKLDRCWLLVADIVESTRLVNELSPDELPLVTGRWVSECKQTIESTGGRINQFMGDGFFAYWRDRERVEVNVHEALEALRRLQEQARPVFRFAVHLGQVAFGGVSVGEEERISGSEVHFVFRQEKLCASLGEARLLSEAAWGRLAVLLTARDVGLHSLSGFDGQFRFYAF